MRSCVSFKLVFGRSCRRGCWDKWVLTTELSLALGSIRHTRAGSMPHLHFRGHRSTLCYIVIVQSLYSVNPYTYSSHFVDGRRNKLHAPTEHDSITCHGMSSLTGENSAVGTESPSMVGLTHCAWSREGAQDFETVPFFTSCCCC